MKCWDTSRPQADVTTWVVDDPVEFANPWHDEVGKFAPKGGGGVRSVMAREVIDRLDAGDIVGFDDAAESFQSAIGDDPQMQEAFDALNDGDEGPMRALAGADAPAATAPITIEGMPLEQQFDMADDAQLELYDMLDRAGVTGPSDMAVWQEGQGYMRAHAVLRGGDTSERGRRYVEELDRTTSAHALPEDTTLWRAGSAPVVKPGDALSDPSFVATSTAMTRSSSWLHGYTEGSSDMPAGAVPTMFRINAPKGQKFGSPERRPIVDGRPARTKADLRLARGEDDVRMEGEIVLPRNLLMTVRGVSTFVNDDGSVVQLVEVDL